MHQYYSLCEALAQNPSIFSSLCCFVIQNNFWQKNVENLINVHFFSLFRVVKLLLKEDSNMLTKELSFYIQDDDWLRWFSAFTFLSVDKSTLIIKSEKEICWDVIKSASFCMTCKSFFSRLKNSFFWNFLDIFSDFLDFSFLFFSFLIKKKSDFSFVVFFWIFLNGFFFFFFFNYLSFSYFLILAFLWNETFFQFFPWNWKSKNSRFFPVKKCFELVQSPQSILSLASAVLFLWKNHLFH